MDPLTLYMLYAESLAAYTLSDYSSSLLFGERPPMKICKAWTKQNTAKHLSQEPYQKQEYKSHPSSLEKKNTSDYATIPH